MAKNKNKKWVWIGLGIFIVLLFITTSLIFFSSTKPSIGDCMDVSKYDYQGITKYCEITGGIRSIGGNEYSVGLDGNTCDFACYDSVADYGFKVNEKRCPLTRVNTIDAHKVNRELCK